MGHHYKVSMNWNWVLVTVTFICVDKKSWDTTGKLTMNDQQGYQWCAYVLELSIGLGYFHTHWQPNHITPLARCPYHMVVYNMISGAMNSVLMYWIWSYHIPQQLNGSYQELHIQNNLWDHESCSHVWQNNNSGSLFPALKLNMEFYFPGNID